MKIMAVDFGEARTGLAVCDLSLIHISALDTANAVADCIAMHEDINDVDLVDITKI